MDRFEYEGKTYVAKVVDMDARTFATSCDGCAFRDYTSCPGIAECRGRVRPDKNWVVFVEEEPCK